jgi:hypothetical protein
VSILAVSTLLLAAALLLSSCFFTDGIVGVRNHNYSATADFSYAIPVTSQSLLQLEGINGTVEITGVTDLDTVEIYGVRRVESDSETDAEAHLDLLLVLVADTANRVQVRTDQPGSSSGRNYIVNYHCRVPAAWDIALANTNGDVILADLGGDLVVRLTNGGVEVDSVAGDLDLAVTNGSLLLWDISGEVDAHLTNGSVIARVVLPASGMCKIGVTNGPIDLRIPDDTSATVNLTVTNGTIDVENLTLANLHVSPTSLTGRLGTGLGTIRLDTTNGVIVLRGY